MNLLDDILEEGNSPDLTPMIDCVFLLLVFFMVTTTLLPSRGLKVALPGAGGEGTPSPVRELNVVVYADGTVEVEGERTDLEGLEGVLKEAVDRYRTDRAVIAAERTVKHREVVRVMDIARDAGIREVALARE